MGQILKNKQKNTVLKRYIDDNLLLWDISKPDIVQFIEQANSHHPTTKFTAEISNIETKFLDMVKYVVVQFYPWFNFDFPLFFSMLIYDNEYQT